MNNDFSGVDSEDVLCQVVDSEGIRESIVAKASTSGAPPSKFRIIGNLFLHTSVHLMCNICSFTARWAFQKAIVIHVQFLRHRLHFHENSRVSLRASRARSECEHKRSYQKSRHLVAGPRLDFTPSSGPRQHSCCPCDCHQTGRSYFQTIDL